MSDKLKLRVDFREDHKGRPKPVLVDARTGIILPEQIYCKVEGGVDGLPTVTVKMYIDGDKVVMGKIGGKMGDDNESSS